MRAASFLALLVYLCSEPITDGRRPPSDLPYGIMSGAFSRTASFDMALVDLDFRLGRRAHQAVLAELAWALCLAAN